jgi:hypothetical protein
MPTRCRFLPDNQSPFNYTQTGEENDSENVNCKQQTLQSRSNLLCNVWESEFSFNGGNHTLDAGLDL